MTDYFLLDLPQMLLDFYFFIVNSGKSYNSGFFMMTILQLCLVVRVFTTGWYF